MRHIRSVLQAPNKPAMKGWERDGCHHPTMKPVSLLAQLIRAYTNPGDWVLDPFAGSGSTALTCFFTGRNCLAYENNTQWFYESTVRFNRIRDMLGLGQVQQLIEQPDKKIDEFDLTALYA